MHVVFGYIDASSGSMLLQAAIGGSMAAIYAGRKFIGSAVHATRAKFSRTPAKTEPKDPTSTGTPS